MVHSIWVWNEMCIAFGSWEAWINKREKPPKEYNRKKRACCLWILLKLIEYIRSATPKKKRTCCLLLLRIKKYRREVHLNITHLKSHNYRVKIDKKKMHWVIELPCWMTMHEWNLLPSTWISSCNNPKHWSRSKCSNGQSNSCSWLWKWATGSGLCIFYLFIICKSRARFRTTNRVRFV